MVTNIQGNIDLVKTKLTNFDLDGKTIIGYADNGHEIHYVEKNQTSLWAIKTGKRNTLPFGDYDGSFFQDYIFEEGHGT